jgi:hypothetical protein
MELFAWAGFNCHPPDLCLLRLDYRHEPWVPSSNSFLVAFVGFSIHKIMLLENSDIITTFFPIWLPFISFSCSDKDFLYYVFDEK